MLLLPGSSQWSWDQPERALVLLGSYLAALGVGLFTWGTPLGMVLLAFAFGTHVASASDTIRQSAFPGFGRWVPVVSSSGGLGLGLYVPALGLATLFAWPGLGTEQGSGLGRSGYLVNCRAYGKAEPSVGDWVWLRSPVPAPVPVPAPASGAAGAPGGARLGRVVARSGQRVEWSDTQLRVDGAPRADRPFRRFPGVLVFNVPAGHVLLAPADQATGRPTRAGRPVLVPHDEILGRAWAQLYPIRERRLLH
jgi:hypothetical protein